MLACLLLVHGAEAAWAVPASVVEIDKRAAKSELRYDVYFVARPVQAAPASLGHAFVVWETTDQSLGMKQAELFGLYPAWASKAEAVVGGPGVLEGRREDWFAEATVVVRVSVSKAAFTKSRTTRDGWATAVESGKVRYALLDGVPGINGQNGISFANGVAEDLGLSVPGSALRLPTEFVQAIAEQAD